MVHLRVKLSQGDSEYCRGSTKIHGKQYVYNPNQFVGDQTKSTSARNRRDYGSIRVCILISMSHFRVRPKSKLFGFDLNPNEQYHTNIKVTYP